MASPQLEIFRREWIDTFQVTKSLLRDSTMTDGMREGGTFTWTLSNPLTGRMSQRGVDGRIPTTVGTDVFVSTPVIEKVQKEIRTKFDIFTAGPSQRAALQRRSIYQIYREMDQEIIDTLTGATTTFGSTGAITFTRINQILSDLYEAKVPADGQITCAWTPRAWSKLVGMPEFTSADYVESKPLPGQPYVEARRWLGATHIMHPELPGVGTASATCFIYHKSAVGHAHDVQKEDVTVGYNDEDKYHYVSSSLIHGSKILQDAGIIKYTHDDTA